MKISNDDLTRFGMDRFTIEVIATKTDGGVLAYKVKTSPIEDSHTTMAVQDTLSDLIEEGAMLAKAFMTSDGSFAMQGFKSLARGRVHTLVTEGRSFYRSRLDAMENEDNLKTMALQTIRTMIIDGTELDKVAFKFDCIDHFAVKAALLGSHTIDERQQVTITLPGTCHGIENGDFKSWWEGKVKDRHNQLVCELLDQELTAAKESSRKTLANIERLERQQNEKRNKHYA